MFFGGRPLWPFGLNTAGAFDVEKGWSEETEEEEEDDSEEDDSEEEDEDDSEEE